MLSRQNGLWVEAYKPFFNPLVMLIFLAESKTMSSNQSSVDENILRENTPVLESIADSLMEYIESLEISQISQILGISNQLAVKTHSLAFDFPHKLTGYKALYGFTGEAFRGFEASSLSNNALQMAQESLRIISSIYGILKPFDIIKPYRCEFNKPIFQENKTSIQIFKQKVTVDIVNYIKENQPSDIINLLPGDADKVIDWKIVRAFSKVHKICFSQITSEGHLKTPIASKLKELRGKMARHILMNNITNFRDLISSPTDDFIYSAADSKPGLPVFIAG